jgi:flagellin-like hook-associated protein FlgL
MISRVDASTEQFINSLERTRARLAKAHEQMSSGTRISSVSDDPDRLGAILSTDADLKRVQQIVYNLSQSKAEVDTG